MRVLFLHANTPDYLSAGLFHGLRSLLGTDCVDLPRFDCMYDPLIGELRQKITGRAFTLYGLLPDLPELAKDRFFIWETDIKNYDYYIIADIWRQWYDYERLCRLVDRERIIVIDPADKPRVFPWNNLLKEHRYFRRSLHFLRLRPRYYYKRETGTEKEALAALPSFLGILKRQLLPAKIRPVSFSIPEEKIIGKDTRERTQLFASNIVDAEISNNVAGSFHTPLGKQQYPFVTEQDYYADLQRSRFGITTKRSGWDCLRHYEIAANGAVICFRNLGQKPKDAAPFDLNQTNCVIYENYTDLMKQVTELSTEAYEKLKLNTAIWIRRYSTVAVARRFIDSFTC